MATALIVSAACHVALFGWGAGASSRGTLSEAGIKVRLTASSPPAVRSPAAAPLPEPTPSAPPEEEKVQAGPQPGFPSSVADRAEKPKLPGDGAGGEPHPETASAPGTSLTTQEATAPEPVFYPAADLDVLPTTLDRPQPQLPVAAGGGNLQGMVTLRLIIDEAGTVIDASVAYANPPGVFDTAAIEAVRTMRFTPGEKEGKSVGSEIFTSVAFGIHPAEPETAPPQVP